MTPAIATSPPCLTIMPATLARVCPERQADADLTRALTHDVGHDAVDADHAEHQRDARGDGDQDHRERHLRGGTIEDVLQRTAPRTAPGSDRSR